jgi:hypothetical protein
MVLVGNDVFSSKREIGAIMKENRKVGLGTCGTCDARDVELTMRRGKKHEVGVCPTCVCSPRKDLGF